MNHRRRHQKSVRWAHRKQEVFPVLKSFRQSLDESLERMKVLYHHRELLGLTKSELKVLAREAQIKGRTLMTREQLIEALT